MTDHDDDVNKTPAPRFDGNTMNAECIRGLLRAQPFVPFDIRMTNGEVHRVRHPELAFLAGNRLVLHYPETDRMLILSLPQAVIEKKR